jgi:hypothetical protein
MTRKRKLPAVRETIGRPKLKERGWTDGLIKKFLPRPYKTEENSYYKSGPPQKLYLLSRVEKIEQSPEFLEAKEQTMKRQASSQKAVETKREKLEQYLETVVIEVPVLDEAELLSAACKEFNADGTSDSYASPHSGQAFLDRITVNYLRHQLTRYEEELEAIAGKVGAQDAYLTIFRKVIEAIGDAYPRLKAECDLQLDKRSEKRFHRLVGW